MPRPGTLGPFQVVKASFVSGNSKTDVLHAARFAINFGMILLDGVKKANVRDLRDARCNSTTEVELEFKSNNAVCFVECQNEGHTADIFAYASEHIAGGKTSKASNPGTSLLSAGRLTTPTQRPKRERDVLDELSGRNTLPTSGGRTAEKPDFPSSSSSFRTVAKAGSQPLEAVTPPTGILGSSESSSQMVSVDTASKRSRIDAACITLERTPQKVGRPGVFTYGRQQPTRERAQSRYSDHVLATKPKSFVSSAQYTGYRSSLTFGLQNLGNTCYLNAVMQALCSLREFVTDLQAMPRIIPQVTQGKIFSGSCEILRSMSNATAGQGPLSPAKLRELIAQACPMFGGNQQQDAHEFLLEYVNQLHDELLGARNLWLDAQSKVESEDVLGVLATQMHLDSEVQKRLECLECKATRDVFERFRDFSLDFPPQRTGELLGSSDQRCELRTMLRNYFASELLEAKCEKCSNPSARMFKYLTQGPRVLVLHLKRFVPNLEKQRYDKQHLHVDIPSQIDLKEYLGEAYAASSAVETPARSKHLLPTLPARPLAAEAHAGHRYSSEHHASADTVPKGKQPPPPLPPPSSPPPPQDPLEHVWDADAVAVTGIPVAVWDVLLGEDWKPFDSHEAKLLEEALTAQQERCEFEARGQRYVFDFTTWEQVNKGTGHCRPIRRRLADVPMPSPQDSTSHSKTRPIYELRSIVSHEGASPHSGHYVCYARGDTGKWRLYDDSLVKELPAEQDTPRSLGRKAYILFYVLRGS